MSESIASEYRFYLFPKPPPDKSFTLLFLSYNTASRAFLGEHFEGQHARAPTHCRGVQ